MDFYCSEGEFIWMWILKGSDAKVVASAAGTLHRNSREPLASLCAALSYAEQRAISGARFHVDRRSLSDLAQLSDDIRRQIRSVNGHLFWADTLTYLESAATQ